jgi:thiamine pyridinylase
VDDIRGKGKLMKKLRTVNSLFTLTVLGFGLGAFGPDANADSRRDLKVVLYPFIPAMADYFQDVKRTFEAEETNVSVTLVDLSANYYYTNASDNVQQTQADVYELDAVLLPDFVAQKRIQPLEQIIAINPAKYLTNAQVASEWNGKWYGIPHWVCGNFLFFRSGDIDPKEMASLTGLEKTVGKPHQVNTGLLVDLKGRLTLGELYLTTAFEHYGDWYKVKAHLSPVEPVLESARLVGLCDPGFGRSKPHHNDTGFYARQFAHKKGRIMIGYSESLFYLLSEAKTNCPATECLSADMLEAAIPPLDDAALMISYVDLLTIDRKCQGQKLQDALEFIEFLNRRDIVLKALLPTEARPPRYLLTAMASLYDDPALTNSLTLYPKLRRIIEGSFPPRVEHLSDTLGQDGALIDSHLPNN